MSPALRQRFSAARRAIPAVKIAAYQDALALCGGDLLPGFYDD